MRTICICVLLLTFTAHPATYYGGPRGSSGNAGTLSSPWDMATLPKYGSNFNTLVILPGKLSGNFQWTGLSNCTIKGQSPWTSIFADGTGGNANLDLESCHDVTVSWLVFSNSAASSGFASGSGNWNITFEHNLVISNYLSGALIGGKGSSNMVARFNYTRGNGHSSTQDHGIYAEGPNAQIYGNVSVYNAGWGIQCYDGFTNNTVNGYLVYNNLTYGNGSGGLVIWSSDGQVDNANSTNGVNLVTQIGTNWICGNTLLDGMDTRFGKLLITNNIILRHVSDRRVIINAAGNRAATLLGDYNMGTNAVLSSAHEVVTNWAGLGFVNPGAGLYWLSAASSARNKANTAVYGSVDFFGNAQSSVTDIGAFQYNPLLTTDTRTLDPSPSYGADYWSMPAVSPPTVPGSTGLGNSSLGNGHF